MTKNAHTCKALAVTCSDFRIQGAVREFLTKQQLTGTCDMLAWPGGAKDIAAPNGLTSKVRLLHDLHGFDTVIMVNHTDCGAYGGSSAFPGEAEETKTHVTELVTARDNLLKEIPNIAVRTFIAHILPTGTVEIMEHV